MGDFKHSEYLLEEQHSKPQAVQEILGLCS